MNFETLARVNAKFNAYPYRPDPAAFDDWSPITPAGGDCESYAVAKFLALLDEGFPRLALRLACCYVEPFTVTDAATGQLREATMAERYHGVLLVDLAQVTWVADNRHARPMRHADLPYSWDRLQIAGTNRWEQAGGALADARLISTPEKETYHGTIT